MLISFPVVAAGNREGETYYQIYNKILVFYKVEHVLTKEFYV